MEDPGRATRTIIMMVDGAIGSLINRGFDRTKDRITIEQSESVLPTYVSIRGRRVFCVDFVRRDGKLVIEGNWISRPSLWARIVRRFRWNRA